MPPLGWNRVGGGGTRFGGFSNLGGVGWARRGFGGQKRRIFKHCFFSTKVDIFLLIH